MASADILIKWASESTAAVRDMGKVNKALKDNMTTAQKWKRGITVASQVAFAGLMIGGAALAKAMRAASEDAKAQAVLVNTLRNTTGATRTQIAAMNEYITAAANATLYTDDQLRPAMGALLRATGDLTASQELLNIAMDAATSTGKDVDAVAVAVGKAYGGNLSALKRLFPFIKDSTVASGDFAAAMQQIERKVKGASAAAADQDPWTLFQQNLDELQETIGALGNTKGFRKMFKDINEALLAFTAWAEENPDTLRNIAAGLAGLASALVALKGALMIGGAVAGAGKALKALWGVVAAIPNPILAAAGWAAFEVMLDRWTAKKGGWYRVISWLKDVGDFLSNPVGTGFEIGIKSAGYALQTLLGLVQRARDAIAGLKNLLGAGLGIGGKMKLAPVVPAGAGLGIGGKMKLAPVVPASALPTTGREPVVGRITAPSAPPTVHVYIDGRAIPARTVAGQRRSTTPALGML